MGDKPVKINLGIQTAAARYTNWGNPAGKTRGTPKSTFQGLCDVLKGYTINCSSAKFVDRLKSVHKETEAYIWCNFDSRAGNQWTINNEKKFNMKILEKLPKGSDNLDKTIWIREVDIYIERKGNIEENIRKVFLLIYRSYTIFETVRSKLLVWYIVFGPYVHRRNLTLADSTMTYFWNGRLES